MSQEVDKPDALGWRRFDPITVVTGVGSAATYLGGFSLAGYGLVEIIRAEEYADTSIPVNREGQIEANEIFKKFSDDAVIEAKQAISQGHKSVTLSLDDQALSDAYATQELQNAHSKLVQELVDTSGAVSTTGIGLALVLPATILFAIATTRHKYRINI